MALISWGSIKSLLVFFGPLLLPKAIGYYRSIRNSSAHPPNGSSIRPIPQPALRALAILFSTALVLVVRSLPPFAPENIFVRSQSRLQIPTDVLFTRLTSLRPNNALTEVDTSLRTKFVNLESRLLYLQFGPAVLADCPFCASDDPRSYMYYALPSLLVPHLVNLIILSLATSDLVSGREGSRWRTFAVVTVGLWAALDVYMVNTYNYQANARATRLSDLDMFFWSSRLYRLLGLALLDGAVASLLYLSSTNRAFFIPPTPAMRVEAVTRQLLAAKSRLHAMGIVKNTTTRDEDLRARTHDYWQHEGRVMREVMEEREVLEGVNDALQNRINIQSISRDAEAYALNVLPRLGPPAPETMVG